MLEMKASRVSRVKVTRTPGRLPKMLILFEIHGRYECKNQER
jgi:hypothetical protein